MSIFSRLSNAYKSFIYKGLDDGTFYRDMSGNYVYNDMQLLKGSLFKEKNNMKEYYFKVPFLADCVNMYADFASQVQIYEEDEDGNIFEDTDFINFLKNPNPFQDFQTYIKEAVINTITSGMFINYGTFFERGDLTLDSQIYNLDLANLSLPKIKNSYLLREKDVSNLPVVENLPDGQQRKYTLEQLAIFYDLGNKAYSGNNNFLNPISRLKSIEVSIQNIIKTEETINFLSGNKAFGLLTKKGGLLTPLDEKQKKQIEDKINFKRKGILTSNDEMAYLSLLIDAKKLQLIEFQNNAKENIRTSLLIPKDLLDASSGETKGITFATEQQQFAEGRFISGNVKGYTDRIFYAIQQKAYKYFERRGTKLKGSYEHMPSQIAINTKLGNEALNNKLSALKSFFEAYQSGLQNGIKIDAKQFLYENGFEGINIQEIEAQINQNTTQNAN